MENINKTPRIALAQLQQEYPGKIVALSKDETQIRATANTFPALFNKLKRQNIEPKDCIYIGPVPKYGTVQVI